MNKILISCTPELDNITTELNKLTSIDTNVIDDIEDKLVEKYCLKKLQAKASPKKFALSKTFIKEYHAIFDDTFLDAFNAEIKKIPRLRTGTMIAYHSLCQKKLDAFDISIGIVIREQDYNLEHLMTHEKLTKKQALAFLKKCNNWLIANKHLYDIFIQNKSLPEISKIIQDL